MAASRVLRDLVMMLREKEEVLEKTQRQLHQKEKECDELKDQCFSHSPGQRWPSLYNALSRLSSLLRQQETRRYRRRVQLSQLYWSDGVA